jgi:biopolymer transport protein ExbD
VSLDELGRLLRQSVADEPQRQTVIVRADENVAHKFVVGAMDACATAGVDDYQVQSAGEE